MTKVEGEKPRQVKPIQVELESLLKWNPSDSDVSLEEGTCEALHIKHTWKKKKTGLNFKNIFTLLVFETFI